MPLGPEPDPVMLPPTVAARRNARLRAAALAVIPLILSVVAAGPRVWAPDLVPFGSRQGEYVLSGMSADASSVLSLYMDLSLTPLALLDPMLRALPLPIQTWVVIRGLLDALGVALLYLAARPIAGRFGAAVAALLYALNPAAWAAARDPAGPFAALLAAAAFLAAVRLVERPTLLRGAVLGLALGLLARGLPVGLIVVPLGAAALAVGGASWKVGGVAALVLVVCAGPALFVGLSLVSPLPLLGLDALRIPGWLFSGLAYRPGDGYPPGARLYGDIAEPMVLLTLGMMVLGGFAAISAAGAGRRAPLLPLFWVLVGWLAAVIIPDPTGRAELLYLPVSTVLDGTLPVAVLPALAVLVALPATMSRAAGRRIGLAGVGLLFACAVMTVAQVSQSIEQDVQSRQAFATPHWEAVAAAPSSTPWSRAGASTSLREWRALADALHDATGRIGARDVVVLDRFHPLTMPEPLAALLRGTVQVRRPGMMVLPVERETAYVIANGDRWESGQPPPEDLALPSSTMAVVTSSGADTGARIVTLRPRPPDDWLARGRAIDDARFADGSALVGVVTRHRASTESTLPEVGVVLYWRLPTVAAGTTVAEQTRIGTQATGVSVDYDVRLPPVESRRDGELVAQRVAVTAPEGQFGEVVLAVALEDGQGNPIGTADGRGYLEVRLGTTER